MNISKSQFGILNGKEVYRYTLSNNNGMQVSIINYGATITSIMIPDSENNPLEISCGFDKIEDYFSEEYIMNSPYFGATIGRYCSQIKDATFNLNGVTYNLSANAGKNNLHGGKVGFDKKLWELESLYEGKEECFIVLTLNSIAMEEGFPGDTLIKLKVLLNNSNELKFNYEAIPEKDTPLSLTNHTYFNLSGFEESIENHLVQISSKEKLKLDETGAAIGEIVSLENNPDDLRNPQTISEVHAKMNDGFEHYYIFEKQDFKLQKIGFIKDIDSNRTLEISTTEPGMLFYTGKYTSDTLKRNSEIKYGKYRGFCCETHRYPNGPNIKNSPKSITNAGETYKSTTIFKFIF
ncbi:galactose mutarotase [Joostella atrarenae]|uniref:Aldose 1-epimerase n=1 Tax=Joostella atrarenae TaxID=679257 RepID=A0ABS9J756_9FLAO|nr:aldose epimerase family protein [Joostella atrarenae]MCF8716260.1 galactose mutarotase [Joostella atrarenae]